MLRKFFVFLFLWMFSFHLATGQDAKKAGDALLDTLIYNFTQMVSHGTGKYGSPGPQSLDKLNQDLQAMMAAAKKANSQGQIDLAFFTRYSRILMILRLATAQDPEGILGPVVNKEIIEFIKEITGEEICAKDKDIIGPAARAIGDEIINLQLYLDNKDQKAKLMKKVEQEVKK